MAKNEIHFRNTDDCINKIKSIRTMYRDTTPSYVALSDAIQALEEIQQHRAIGTVEEFKALKEKNEPKKAIFDNENEIYICSRCGKKVGEHQNYCWSCGQAFYT